MNPSINVICYGCLNTGRKIITVEDIGAKRIFMQIISGISMSASNNLVRLCFECAAFLSKFSKFNKQVQNSYKTLIGYDGQDNSLKYDNVQPYTNLRSQNLYNFSTEGNESFEDITKSEVIETENDIYSNIKEEAEISNTEDDTPLIHRKKRKRKGVKIKREKVIEIEFTEVELSTQEIEDERRSLELSDDFVNAMFRCEKCIMSFPNSEDLEDHINAKHILNASNYKCTICECSFATEVSYNYHTNKHIKRYQCTVCGERFGSKRAVLKHYNMIHCHGTGLDIEWDNVKNGDQNINEVNNQTASSPQESFACDFCVKTFKWKTSLRKHLETHRIETGQKRKPYCAPCRLSFTTSSNLQKHVRTSSKHQIQYTELNDLEGADGQRARDEIKSRVSIARAQFPCTQCDKRFMWRGNLLRHLHSHAAKAKGDLVCKPCNRTFSSIATYQQHMKISKMHATEDDYKFMCSDCGKRFPTKSRLRDHINWEHLKNFVYTCDECQKVFKTSNSVYLHKQAVHKKDSAEHLCDHCGKPFPNNAKLRNHILGTHSGTAAYRCAWCGARFSWHSCLSRHVRQKHRPPHDNKH